MYTYLDLLRELQAMSAEQLGRPVLVVSSMASVDEEEELTSDEVLPASCLEHFKDCGIDHTALTVDLEHTSGLVYHKGHIIQTK